MIAPLLLAGGCLIFLSVRRRHNAFAESLARQALKLKQLNEHLVYSEEIGRKSIASDLHDSIAQTLAMGISRIKTLKESDRPVAAGELSDLQAVLEQAVHEVRSLIYKLSPPILEDFDIDIAIGFLVEETNKENNVHFVYTNRLENTVPLKHAIKVTLYRAVSELLANILKHAGTREADIDIRTDGQMLFIRVCDQGAGMDVKQEKDLWESGFGLYSLSERMENFGGSLHIDSQPGKGTVVRIAAPILKEEPGNE